MRKIKITFKIVPYIYQLTMKLFLSLFKLLKIKSADQLSPHEICLVLMMIRIVPHVRNREVKQKAHCVFGFCGNSSSSLLLNLPISFLGWLLPPPLDSPRSLYERQETPREFPKD